MRTNFQSDIITITTGCPEVPYNFDTLLFSGMASDIRLIIGVVKVQMKTFFRCIKLGVWYPNGSQKSDANYKD